MFVVRPQPKHFLLWLLFLPVWCMEIPTLHWVVNVHALHDPGRVRHATAQVLAYGTIEGGGYFVRYRFQQPGDSTWFSVGNPFRSPTAVQPIDQPTWNHIVQHRTLDIVYLPENPWANKPAAASDGLKVGSYWLWGLLVPFDLFWLVETGFIVRNYRRCAIAAEYRIPKHTHFWTSVPLVTR